MKTTNPKKYCVRPNTGIVLPRSTCDVIGKHLKLLLPMCLIFILLLLLFVLFALNAKVFKFIHGVVTMQAQKEEPPDMQCRDKFLLQSVVTSPGTTTKDISAEMVLTICDLLLFVYSSFVLGVNVATLVSVSVKNSV